ncbi:MAG: porin, partial [Rhodospirillales bacterium]
MVTRLYLIPICVLFIGLGAPLAQKAGAAEQIKLSLGGKMEQYFFFADVDQLPGESLNSSGALSDVEVYFSGKTVLDNGVEISAKIEMRAENKNSGEVDEQYLDVKTAFGRLNIGEKEGFNQNFSYETPYVAYEDDEIIGRIVPQRTMIGVKEIMTFERFTGDAFQIGYESPTIRGLTVGANYFPTTTQGEDGYFDKSTRDNNAWEVSAAWEGRIKAGKLGLVGGYFDSQSRTLGNDGETAWNVSA